MIAKASKNSFLDYKSGGVKIGQISHESWSVGRHCRAGSIFAMEIGIVRDKRDRSPIGSRSSYWRNSPLNPMLSAIRKLAMTRASSSPSGFDRYPRPDAFDRLSQCSLSASFRLAGNTRHRLLTNRLRCYASLSHRPGFARESEALYTQ